MHQRKIPPSRALYEENHPTFTCRLRLEEALTLESIMETEGLSFADIVRRALGTESREHLQAFQDGRTDARSTEDNFHVPCSTCGKPIHLSSGDQKWERERAVLYQALSGWRHITTYKRK